MKHEIEIEGLPVGWRAVAYRRPIMNVDYILLDDFDITVYLKKKEPEYLEVREYLHNGSYGYVLHNSIQKNLHQKASDIESLPHFIKWLDDDWRKIYI